MAADYRHLCALATVTHNPLNDVRFLAVCARATANWLWEGVNRLTTINRSKVRLQTRDVVDIVVFGIPDVDFESIVPTATNNRHWRLDPCISVAASP